jgi:hypothetical protein
MNALPKEIRCRDHGLAPWGFVCIHLATGASRQWVPASQDSGPGSENDWLCPACAAKSEPTDQSLRLLCVHCIQAMQQRVEATSEKGSPPPESSCDITAAVARDCPSSPTIAEKLDSLNQRVQALLAKQHTSVQ